MTERIRRCSYTALSLTFMVWAVRNWTRTFQDLRRFYTNVQIRDAFDWLAHYDRYRHLDLGVLWVQHNEHRELGTELLFAIDMLLFQGRQILPTVAGVAAYIGTALIFAAFAFYDTSFCDTKERWPIWSGVLLVAALAGYKLCVVSLAIPFLSSWPQREFFGAASLAAAVYHPRRGGKLMLILAIGFAVAAGYSMLNGMLLWPVLGGAAWLMRYSKRHLAAIALCGLVAIGTYFINYRNMHSLSPSVAFAHPVYLARFLGVLLGMPFSLALGFSNMLRSSCYGWLALAIAAADLAWILRRRLWAAPPVVVMGGYCLLTLASATVTAAGIMDVTDQYYRAARAGGYFTEPLLFWCALLLLTVWLLRRSLHGFGVLLFVLAMGGMASVTLAQTGDYYEWWQQYFQRGQWAAIALGNGVVDNEIASVLYPDPNFVFLNRHILTDNRLAEFADAEPGWIGRQAAGLFKRGLDGFVHGDITTVKKRGVDYEVQGWADGATKLIFTGEKGQILGYALQPAAGVDQLYTHDVPRKLAFTGFLRGQSGERVFATWAIDRAGRQMFRLGPLRRELPR